VHMPRNSTAIVFAVPSPLDTSIVPHKRVRDIRIVDGGLLVLDPARCSPRGFCMLLPYDRVYACHAAAIVHAKMNWQHHEVNIVQLALYTICCIVYTVACTHSHPCVCTSVFVRSIVAYIDVNASIQ
jgi:hypothetical protein